MYKKYFTLLISLLLLLPACKGEDKIPAVPEDTTALLSTDALATYKGGEINEADFTAWMRAHHYPEGKIAAILGNWQRQGGHLRSMVLEILTSREAEIAGYDKSEEFRITARHAQKNYLLKYFRKKLRENAEFNEECVRVRMIWFEVLDYKLVNGVKKIKLPEEELEKKYKEKIDLAKNLIEKLDNGADFAELAREVSDDQSKRTGGDIGYIYYQMKEQAFADAAFSLKKGEYTKVPVRTERGVYIIKMEDSVEVSEKNIEKLIQDQNNAKSLKNRLSFFTARRYEIGLEKAQDAYDFYKKLKEGTPDTVLFEVSQKDFTIAEFDRALSEPGDTDKTEQNIFRSQLSLTDALLLREIFKQGINHEPAFKKTWKIIRRSALSKAYKNNFILALSKIKITDDEIETERKNMKAVNEKKGDIDRDVILKILTGRKRFAKKIKFEEDVLTKNEFAVM